MQAEPRQMPIEQNFKVLLQQKGAMAMTDGLPARYPGKALRRPFTRICSNDTSFAISL